METAVDEAEARPWLVAVGTSRLDGCFGISAGGVRAEKTGSAISPPLRSDEGSLGFLGAAEQLRAA